MRSQEITQFTRQLATLLQSGVALLQALDIVIKGMPAGKAKNVVRAIRRRIEGGSALHLARRIWQRLLRCRRSRRGSGHARDHARAFGRAPRKN